MTTTATLIEPANSLAVQQPVVQSTQTQSLDKSALAVISSHDGLDIMSSGSHQAREARAQQLAYNFSNGLGAFAGKFISAHSVEIVEVRQDFAVKPKDELICGVKTFTEFCEAVLGYSIRHIDRILEGHNPALSDAENADARQRKAKRELDAKVKRTQSALPIRPKTNAEIVAEARTAKVEEKKVDVLQKQVAVLTHKLQTAVGTPSPVSESQAKDLTKIHAAEVDRLEAEIKHWKGVSEIVATAHKKLRKDAVGLATAIRQANNVPAGIATRAAVFLQKHGETVGGAS